MSNLQHLILDEAGVLKSGSQLVARWDAPVVAPVGEHDLARGHRRHNDADAVERLPDRAATVDNRRPDAGLDRRPLVETIADTFVFNEQVGLLEPGATVGRPLTLEEDRLAHAAP